MNPMGMGQYPMGMNPMAMMMQMQQMMQNMQSQQAENKPLWKSNTQSDTQNSKGIGLIKKYLYMFTK